VTTATDIFVNGVIGVFTGIAVLYVLMRVLAAVLGRPAPESAPADPASD
jgi:Na+-transporting methylmalonyl-CoA/oxaloacetate decarboxylase gamma subunit